MAYAVGGIDHIRPNANLLARQRKRDSAETCNGRTGPRRDTLGRAVSGVPRWGARPVCRRGRPEAQGCQGVAFRVGRFGEGLAGPEDDANEGIGSAELAGSWLFLA